ncbi:MAG: chromosome partitioning protein [Spirochaetaceae bacterium]|jgi:hypothetical protein|nr:chromosome partitioning protein [Spirochaetaceae bacterium]
MDKINLPAEDFRGMDAAGAKEYRYHAAVTLKLTEKKLEAVEGEILKWKGRVALSRSRGEDALAGEAEAMVRQFEAEREALTGEIRDLTGEIEGLRRQLPGLAARERSIDPDILEQELLLALGKTGAEDARKTDEELKQLPADAALEALKEKMRKTGSL